MAGHIKPGLQRITRLLHGVEQTWPAVHVAGTNGKGTVCAYITAMLRRARVKTGRFTSPHLIDRWDGITINDRPVSQSLFEEVEDAVKKRDREEDIGASSFELLTATAYQVFNREKVDMAVVECGMGAREDATNVLQKTVVSVVTNVGLDHQEYLGKTTGEIAWHKAGVLKAGVPWILGQAFQDDLEVGKVFQHEGGTLKAPFVKPGGHVKGCAPHKMRPHGHIPMAIASRAVELAAPTLRAAGNPYFKRRHSSEKMQYDLNPAMSDVVFPGRMQTLSIKCLTGREKPILIDGAHNQAAWDALRRHVNMTLKKKFGPLRATKEAPTTWILAMSSKEAKSMSKLILTLCKEEDFVFLTGFGPVDGMPWIEPAKLSVDDLDEKLQSRLHKLHFCYDEPLLDVLKKATTAAHNGALVISGSLYLISDVMRLLRDAGQDPREPNDVSDLLDI